MKKFNFETVEQLMAQPSLADLPVDQQVSIVEEYCKGNGNRHQIEFTLYSAKDTIPAEVQSLLIMQDNQVRQRVKMFEQVFGSVDPSIKMLLL